MKCLFQIAVTLSLGLILNFVDAIGHAQGTAFNYQGRLNASGSPANGSYDLKFTLFTNNTAGLVFAGPVTNTATAVTNGLFTTTINFGNTFTGTSNWLEIAVSTNGANSFSTLSPRQQLTPVPYALYSANAASAVTAVTATTAASANSISAANINGVISTAQLPAVVVTNGENGVSISGTFSGNGAGVTNLNASQLSSGTVPLAQLSGITSNQLSAVTWQLATNSNGGDAALATNVVAGISITNAFVTNSIFAGNGGGLTNLNAAQLTGTVPLAQLSGITSNQLSAVTWQLATNSNGGDAALATNVVAGISITNAFVTNSIFAGNGGGLTNLNAAQLTGTVPLAQLSGITSNQLSAVTWQLATNSNGGDAALATNVVAGISITNAFVTNSIFAGNGGGLTNLNASRLASGTIPLAQLPGAVVTNNNAAPVTLNGTFSGDGSGLNNLNASQLAGGVVPLNVLPGFQAPNYIAIGGGQNNSANAFAATIGGGNNNTNTSSAGTIAGGQNNLITGTYQPAIGGGYGNEASGSYATVAGGYQNSADGQFASVGGGKTNTVSADYGAVAGGQFNEVSASYGFVGGGNQNTAAGTYSTVGGGQSNQTGDANQTISGGSANTILGSATSGTIGGGIDNTILSGAFNSVISGGALNTNGASRGVIAGGRANQIQPGTVYGVVSGGNNNNVTGQYGFIAGGQNNVATNFAFAAGQNAQATNPGAFVWADSQAGQFNSTAANQFLIRAAGGVGINTNNSSGAALNVNGNINTFGNATVNGNISAVNINAAGTVSASAIQSLSSINANLVDADIAIVSTVNATTVDANNVSAGPVTASSVTVNGNPVIDSLATGGSLRAIYGVVNSDGTVASGAGFTVSHLGTGIYGVTYSSSAQFSHVPAATITLNQSGLSILLGQVAIIEAQNTNGFTVNISYSASQSLIDNGFNFVVMGPH